MSSEAEGVVLAFNQPDRSEQDVVDGDGAVVGNDPLSRPILSPNFIGKDLVEWTNCALLIPHEPIRSGLATLVEITDPTQSHFRDRDIYGRDNEGRWGKQIKLLFRWYNGIFHLYVHHHHDVEESIYFPWLQDRTEKLPDKITKDHGELITMMDDIKHSEMTFFDGSGAIKEKEFATNLKRLHDACIILRYSMEEHLNEEELIVPGLLRKHRVTEQEQEVVVDRIVKSAGLKGNKISLPWIIDCMRQWGGPEKVKAFRSSIPWPIRVAQDKWWNAQHTKRNKKIALRIIAA